MANRGAARLSLPGVEGVGFDFGQLRLVFCDLAFPDAAHVRRGRDLEVALHFGDAGPEIADGGVAFRCGFIDGLDSLNFVQGLTIA